MPCLESTCSIFSTYTALISDSDLSNETNKRTSLHCKPLTRSKNEDTNKRTTVLQSTLCGQINPITREENTPLSPIICIRCLRLDLLWFFLSGPGSIILVVVVVVVNRSLLKFSMSRAARTKPFLMEIFFVL